MNILSTSKKPITLGSVATKTSTAISAFTLALTTLEEANKEAKELSAKNAETIQQLMDENDTLHVTQEQNDNIINNIKKLIGIQ